MHIQIFYHMKTLFFTPFVYVYFEPPYMGILDTYLVLVICSSSLQPISVSRRITDITSSVLVGQGEPAHLECAVDANPMNKNTIRWERKGYDMATRTKTTMGKFF